MSQDTETLRALYKRLKETQRELDALRRAGREPIAVIGMACRLPGGADTIPEYRALLEAGADGIADVPAARWDGARYHNLDPGAAGGTITNRAGFLRESVDGCDCAFFHLSPIEAKSMDPQQRLLLEVCWEALEDAGIDPERLRGSRTGVYCGIANCDYAAAHLRSGDPARIDAYSVTGSALSAAAGRLSYLFGFEGPSLAVDTACSSSLVAVHLACRSLRSDESDLAVAAGVNLILSPEGHIGFSRVRALSPDGVCKSFDDAADGYGRGEGCGVVVLKRLADAQRDGDPVRALLLGSAVNQDGRTNGFTAPSGRAQERVLREALADAGLGPEAIGYLEAHGTGTPLGDPIEMEAIGKVYGARRTPLQVGSVKANIGHLEAAAGIAGLIKAVLALESDLIFPQIHFHTPNRHIPWAALPVAIPQGLAPWPAGPRPRTAAVSSFGFSGTNAHVILREAPTAPREPVAGDRSRHLLPLSAREPEALRALAARHRDYLATSREAVGDVCFTAARRPPFRHRAAVVGGSADELRAALESYLVGRPASSLSSGEAAETGEPPVVFLFTGQGSQYPGMGSELYRTSPVFREAMERCAAILRPHVDRSLTDLLYGEGGEEALRLTQHAQPAIFALEYALASLLESWGVRPAAVLGHSVGEYVAATLAGILDLEAALGLVAARGRLVGALPTGGRMAAIAAAESTVRDGMAAAAGRLSIAAVNGPRSTVVSGEGSAVEALCARLREARIATAFLPVSHAFHSCLLDPVLEPFEGLASGVRYRPPARPIYSTVTGAAGGAEMATPRYWVEQLRSPVRFLDGMRAVAAAGYRVFLEVGGTGTLTSLGRQCLPDLEARWLCTLGSPEGAAPARGREAGEGSDWGPMLQGLAGLYAAGYPIDWEEFDRPYRRRRVRLPHYPFQRMACWLDLPVLGDRGPGTASRAAAGATGAAPADADGLLGGHLQIVSRQVGLLFRQAATLGGARRGAAEALLDRQATLIQEMERLRKGDATR